MTLVQAEYECGKCNRVYSSEGYSRSRFCPACGTHLWPKYVKEPNPQGKKSDIQPIELTRDQINVATLFEEFMRLENFNGGEGTYFEDVPSWIQARKIAYNDFRERFRQDKLVDWDKLRKDFDEFLHFKHNKSWTTLYRTGLQVLSHIDRLWRLLTFVQDESINVETRVSEGLQGKYYCRGIGSNILTALLHTFNPNKYGVWNSRTVDTLRLIRRMPKSSVGFGHKYVLINEELVQLGKELNTELTTVDGLMWYISERVKPKAPLLHSL